MLAGFLLERDVSKRHDFCRNRINRGHFAFRGRTFMKTGFLALLGLCTTAANAADVFTFVNWNKLMTYEGTATSPMVTQPGDPMPPGWNVWIDSNEGNVQVNAQATRRKNQAGVTTKDWFGKTDFTVNVLTDKPTNSKFSLTARHTGIATAHVEIQFPSAMAYGRASTTYPNLKTRELKAHVGNIYEEESKGPTSIKKGWTFTGKTWTSLGGGMSEINLLLPTGMIAGKGVATSPGGGGNMTASMGQGNAVEKVKVLALNMTPGSANAGFVSGTRDSFIDDLQVEVRNQYNALLDTWSVGGTPVDWDLPFSDFSDGTYRLLFWAPGSLRKRIDVNYVASTGVSGVSVALLFGDIDTNNAISQAEVDAIANYSGRTWMDAGWRDEVPGLGCRIMDCDLNQDNQVTASDYLLAIGNVGLIGD